MKVLLLLLLVTFAACNGQSHNFRGSGHAYNQYQYQNGGQGGGVGNYGNQYQVTNCRMCPYGTPCTYVSPGMSYCGQQQNNNNNNNNQCYQPMDPGHCPSNYFTRYYYDHYSQACRDFRYSGCGGNGNRFTSLRDCRRTCQSSRGGGGRGGGVGGMGVGMGMAGQGGRGWGMRG